MNHIVNLTETVELQSELLEVVTQDGAALIVTKKTPAGGKTQKYPVLLVHGLAQNRYSWDLSKRSMANYLVKNGFEVYIAELRGHGLSRENGSKYPKHFEEYVDFDIPALVNFILKKSSVDKIFYIGHSLGGTLSYCVTPELQQHFAGVISIAGPSHFAKGVPLIQTLSKVVHDVNERTGFIGMLPEYFMADFGGVLTSYFIGLLNMPMAAAVNMIWYPGTTEDDVIRERVVKGYDRTGMHVAMSMMQWARTGRFEGYSDERDYEKKMSEITTPYLFVAGDEDLVVPEESWQIAYDKIGSKDKTKRVFTLTKDGSHFGHLDLICGMPAVTTTWPFMADWLKKRGSS